MFDMTTYVAQAGARAHWTPGQQTILLQQFQNGAMQAIAETANGTSAAAVGDGITVTVH